MIWRYGGMETLHVIVGRSWSSACCSPPAGKQRNREACRLSIVDCRLSIALVVERVEAIVSVSYCKRKPEQSSRLYRVLRRVSATGAIHEHAYCSLLLQDTNTLLLIALPIALLTAARQLTASVGSGQQGGWCVVCSIAHSIAHSIGQRVYSI